MTQPGETEGYTVAEHIQAIDNIAEQKLFDAVMVHRRSPSPRTLRRYADDKSHPVYVDREEISALGRRVVIANIMEEDPETGYVRHDSARLARVLLRWYSGNSP